MNAGSTSRTQRRPPSRPRLVALCLGCLAISTPISAQHLTGVTVQSVSSEYTLAPWDLRAIHVVDGSGLVDGGHDVTDPSGNSWQTISTVDTARIVFDLGGVHNLGSVHVWNLNFYAPYNGRGASTVIISTSTDLSGWTSHGTHSFPKASGLAGDRGFDIDASSWGQARYVEFNITDIHHGDDDAGHVGLSEVRFYPPASHLLSVAKGGTGAGSVTSTAPAGAITCGGTCAASFEHGTTVTLEAVPAAGSLFEGWTGACDGSASCTLLMDQARSVTATFVPKPIYTRYLAEGATSAFFDTRLALLNPGNAATTATLTFARVGASPIVHTVPVAARTRVTVEPKTLAGMASAEFSTRVESDEPLVVDRLLSWDVASGYGAHAETAVAAPATTWYLAEGATHSGFNLFYLLQNPNPVETQVRVRYLLPNGTPLEKTYALPPASRTNIWVNHEEFPGRGTALAATDVSAVLDSTNAQSFIVERALYLDVSGTMFAAGHESCGVTAPAMNWFLAEGNTGPYFDLFVLIANPGNAPAEVEATYLLPSGHVVTKTYTVAATSRFNIWVDGEDAALADTAVSTTIRSTNGVPVIVERALWWPGTFGQWYEAHNSPGATSTGTAWALAEGEVGGTRGVDTYILLANTSSSPGSVRVTLLFEDAAPIEKTFTVAARSRFNVDVRSEFAGAIDKRFGAIVESLGATPAQIVVERAMYWDAAGQFWAAGTNALATRVR